MADFALDPPAPKLTHAELVTRAASWLANKRKCRLVLSEPQCWAVSEFPDAIGWTTRGHSVLVECKVSVADFKRDAYKPSKHHAREMGTETMGDERWYLTPPALLRKEQIPEGYGLAEVHGRKIVTVVKATVSRRPGTDSAELPLLIWALRKDSFASVNGGDTKKQWGAIRLVVERAPTDAADNEVGGG